MGRRRHGSGVAASTAVPVKPDRRADVHPQGVGRIRSAPSSLTAALAIGPYKLLCRITRGATAAVLPHQRHSSESGSVFVIQIFINNHLWMFMFTLWTTVERLFHKMTC